MYTKSKMSTAKLKLLNVKFFISYCSIISKSHQKKLTSWPKSYYGIT